MVGPRAASSSRRWTSWSSAPTWTGRVYPAAPLTQAPPSRVASAAPTERGRPRETVAQRGPSPAGPTSRAETPRSPHRAGPARGPGDRPALTTEPARRGCGEVETRVRLAVEHRRADDPAPDDPFRGLYVNDETVDRLLGRAAGPRLAAAFASRMPPTGRRAGAARWRRLARARRRSTAFDVELLVIALVPDLDSRFEQLYGYLNDDVTRRRATHRVGAGAGRRLRDSTPARRALSPSGPLVDIGLVLVEDPERPFLTRSLRVPDRVAAHLLGDRRPDAADRSWCCSTWRGIGGALPTGWPTRCAPGSSSSTSGSTSPGPAAATAVAALAGGRARGGRRRPDRF